MSAEPDGRWIVGRADDCDVVTTDEYASPHHCEVVRIGGDFFVRDLGSTNGTRIRSQVGPHPALTTSQDRRVTTWAALRPGDALVVGRSVIPYAPREAP